MSSVESSSLATGVSVALRFGRHIAAGDHAAACELLCREARGEWPPARIAEAVAEMTAHAGEPILRASVSHDGAAADWPDRRSDEVAWVYVALEGESFCEAVTVVVVREDGRLLLRIVDWGRP